MRVPYYDYSTIYPQNPILIIKASRHYCEDSKGFKHVVNGHKLKETTGGEFMLYRASNIKYIDLLQGSYSGDYPPENVLEQTFKGLVFMKEHGLRAKIQGVVAFGHSN